MFNLLVFALVAVILAVRGASQDAWQWWALAFLLVLLARNIGRVREEIETVKQENRK